MARGLRGCCTQGGPVKMCLSNTKVLGKTVPRHPLWSRRTLHPPPAALLGGGVSWTVGPISPRDAGKADHADLPRFSPVGSESRYRWWQIAPRLSVCVTDWLGGTYPHHRRAQKGHLNGQQSTSCFIPKLAVRAPPHPTTVGRVPKEGCGSRAWWCAVPGDTASPGTTRQHESANLHAVRRNWWVGSFLGRGARARIGSSTS